MRFIDNILKIDYVLADWFSKTNQTIIDGTVFLFLNKVTFLLTATYFAILPILPFKMKLEVAIVVLCSVIAVVMFGFQSKIRIAVVSLNYSKELLTLSKSQKSIKRLYGVFLFIGCFTLMLIVGIVSFESYGS